MGFRGLTVATGADIPGPPGPQGPPGEQGENCWEPLMIAFTQPAVGQAGIAATARINAFAVGTYVHIAGLGYLEVTGQSPLELTNPGWPGNAPPNTIAPVGTLVIVAGIKGADPAGNYLPLTGGVLSGGLRIQYPAPPAAQWNLQHLVLQHSDRDGVNNAQNAGSATIVFLNLNDPANGGQTFARMRFSNTEPIFEFKHIINEGEFFGVRASGFITPGQNEGLLMADGATVYKLGGSGIMLRCDSTNRQPQIEDNNGFPSSRRDIVDTQNFNLLGDARYMQLGVPGTGIGPWQTFVPDIGFTNSTLRYRILDGVQLQMDGEADGTNSGGTWMSLGLLPGGARPTRTQQDLFVLTTSGATLTAGIVEIAPAGLVRIYPLGPMTSLRINLIVALD